MSNTEPLHFSIGGYDLADALRSFRFDAFPASSRFDAFPAASMKSTNEHHALIDQLHRLSAEGRDLSEIKAAIEKIDEKQRERLDKALAGIADMALMEKTKVRRFVIAYFLGGVGATLNGVAFEGAERDEDDKEPGYDDVVIEGDDSPVSGSYSTMKVLRHHLADRGIPYRIAFYDN